MITNKYLRKRTLMLMFLWFYRVFVYFGFIFSIGSFGITLPLAVFLLGFSEVIACLLSGMF